MSHGVGELDRTWRALLASGTCLEAANTSGARLNLRPNDSSLVVVGECYLLLHVLDRNSEHDVVYALYTEKLRVYLGFPIAMHAVLCGVHQAVCLAVAISGSSAARWRASGMIGYLP